jgi:hypothetical protein
MSIFKINFVKTFSLQSQVLQTMQILQAFSLFRKM